MGSSLSPVIAELTMQKLEENFQNECVLLGKVPKVWLRLVDDVFVVGNRTFFQDWLALCNAQNIDLGFTMELEKNDTLPFLDVQVKRVRGLLELSVYRKPMATDRVLPFSSSHHNAQKWG